MREDLAQHLLAEASKLGASFAEVRFEDTTRELINYVNGRVVALGYTRSKGAGIRVLYEGALGFSSTGDLTREGLLSALKEAFRAAKSLAPGDRKLCPPELRSKVFRIDGVKNHPSSASLEEKLDLVKRAYSVAKEGGAASATARYGAHHGTVEVYTSDGVSVSVDRLVVGVSTSIVLREAGRVGDGFETFGASRGLEVFTGENSPESVAQRALSHARDSLRASRPPAGNLVVITRPDLTGVFAHESFGHLTEGDFVAAGTSPLTGRLGELIASEVVTIVDSGFDERGGYLLLADDEGVPTKRTVLVEKGVLKSYLQSRESSALLSMEPTGNGRAQSFEHEVIVRMRNTFFEAGDWGEEEIIEDTRRGLLLDKPAGGQVEEDGTFTFNARIGYVVEGGELKEPVKDVVLAGNILEMLKHVDAATEKVVISTSPFGGCGKMGQMVHVGDGGPTLRTMLLVGGEKK
ncbi:MAG: TldD/PmbA family protein [Thermofilaceae archaeon]|nr:TldD/PmbA family protein [Thermofilaceae archaeon]MDW8004451.1 TldD/PmbA family protein [Thermofilaceae archaeon]